MYKILHIVILFVLSLGMVLPLLKKGWNNGKNFLGNTLRSIPPSITTLTSAAAGDLFRILTEGPRNASSSVSFSLRAFSDDLSQTTQGNLPHTLGNTVMTIPKALGRTIEGTTKALYSTLIQPRSSVSQSINNGLIASAHMANEWFSTDAKKPEAVHVTDIEIKGSSAPSKYGSLGESYETKSSVSKVSKNTLNAPINIVMDGLRRPVESAAYFFDGLASGFDSFNQFGKNIKNDWKEVYTSGSFWQKTKKTGGAVRENIKSVGALVKDSVWSAVQTVAGPIIMPTINLAGRRRNRGIRSLFRTADRKTIESNTLASKPRYQKVDGFFRRKPGNASASVSSSTDSAESPPKQSSEKKSSPDADPKQSKSRRKRVKNWFGGDKSKDKKKAIVEKKFVPTDTVLDFVQEIDSQKNDLWKKMEEQNTQAKNLAGDSKKKYQEITRQMGADLAAVERFYYEVDKVKQSKGDVFEEKDLSGVRYALAALSAPINDREAILQSTSSDKNVDSEKSSLINEQITAFIDEEKKISAAIKKQNIQAKDLSDEKKKLFAEASRKMENDVDRIATLGQMIKKIKKGENITIDQENFNAATAALASLEGIIKEREAILSGVASTTTPESKNAPSDTPEPSQAPSQPSSPKQSKKISYEGRDIDRVDYEHGDCGPAMVMDTLSYLGIPSKHGLSDIRSLGGSTKPVREGTEMEHIMKYIEDHHGMKNIKTVNDEKVKIAPENFDGIISQIDAMRPGQFCFTTIDDHFRSFVKNDDGTLTMIDPNTSGPQKITQEQFTNEKLIPAKEYGMRNRENAQANPDKKVYYYALAFYDPKPQTSQNVTPTPST